MITPGEFALLAVKARRRQLREELAELAPELVLTAHACDRAWEMGVPAGAIARMVAEGSSWPVSSDTARGVIHHTPAGELARWAVITAEGAPERIVTVIFWAPDGPVVRRGRDFEPAPEDPPTR